MLIFKRVPTKHYPLPNINKTLRQKQNIATSLMFWWLFCLWHVNWFLNLTFFTLNFWLENVKILLAKMQVLYWSRSTWSSFQTLTHKLRDEQEARVKETNGESTGVLFITSPEKLQFFFTHPSFVLLFF